MNVKLNLAEFEHSNSKICSEVFICKGVFLGADTHKFHYFGQKN